MNIMSLHTEFNTLKESTQNSKLESALKLVVNMILDALTPKLAQLFIGKLLDSLEEISKKTDNKVDDIIIHALCNKARQILNIEEVPENFDKMTSEFIKSGIDEYTPEINFGTTDTMQALRDDIDSAIKNKKLNKIC